MSAKILKKKNTQTVERMIRLLLGLVSLSLTFMGTKTAWGVLGVPST